MDISPALALPLGLALLIGGGQAVVSNAVALAARLGLSRMFIGFVIVGFGTSSPELVTGISAALSGKPAISFGNVIGANTANFLLILGVAAVLRPVPVRLDTVRRDGLAVAAAFVAIILVSLPGAPARLGGIMMVVSLLAYVCLTWWAEARGAAERRETGMREAVNEAANPNPVENPLRALAALLIGIVGLIVGAHLLVDAAVSVALAIGVSPALIGLTIVAIGTCLPELVTAIIASMRNEAEVTVGNAFGSSLFNSLGVFGLVVAISGVALPPELLRQDVPVMVGSLLLASLLAFRKPMITRLEGLALLSIYVAYLALRVWAEAG